MPKVGKKHFAYDAEGIVKAKAESEKTGTPISNAQDRSQNYYMGGSVLPPNRQLGGFGQGRGRQLMPQPGDSRLEKGGKAKK